MTGADPILTRGELVRLNKLQRDYAQDDLPNVMQVRYDVAWLIARLMKASRDLETTLRGMAL